MPLTIGKRDVAKAADLLEQEYESAEDAAQALLEFAFDLYEKKAKYTVVGQLRYSNGFVDPASEEAVKIALGAYGTETQAINAARSLVLSTSTNEEFRAWPLPVWHGTPAAFFKERKKLIGVRELGATPTDKLIHFMQWERDNPDKDRDEYPGVEAPDPRGDCPFCGASTELED